MYRGTEKVEDESKLDFDGVELYIEIENIK